MANVDLIAIRHAATEWNEAGRFQGLSDISLSEKGRAEAALVGQKLRSHLAELGRSALWVSSPLRRSTATMEIIRAEVGLDPAGYKTDHRLVEAGFGRWEGLTTHEVKARFPEERRARRAGRWSFAPLGGDSYADLAKAMRAFLADLPPAVPAVVVTHSGNLRVLLGCLRGLSESETMALSVPHETIWRWRDGVLTTH